jgi:hypothetical protein
MQREHAMTANPALADLRFLAGRWDMELSAASFLPDPGATAPGSVTFDWIEDGSALVMRMAAAARWIIGRDDAEEYYHVLYADDRGVSRVYRMSLQDHVWRLWRHSAGFSQRFEARVDDDEAEIIGHWEKSVDGGVTWEHDFNVSYRRPNAAGAAAPISAGEPNS